jgi:uncharacterized membrane protein YvbJ
MIDAKFCSTCGTAVAAGHTACSQCGADLGNTASGGQPSRLRTRSDMRRGAIWCAVSLSIGIVLVATRVTAYAISPIGFVMWGMLAYGIFLMSRDLYRRFK